VVSAVTVAALIGAVAAIGWTSAIPAISPPAPSSFDKALIARGANLAEIGNCAGCHTASHGRALAGGRPLPTPFGTVYATNITPDVGTGIGGWSQAAFVRAMRQGIARDGSYLYPVFPYDHFTNASDDELAALYAFLMTRTPVNSTTPANSLQALLSARWLMAGWNFLYLHPGPMADDPGQSAQWNRGRALAEGLAHCGACHTPRNSLGAEDRSRAYDGAWVEGWYAPALNAHSPAIRPWTQEALFAYLRTGLSRTHAAAAGPMAGVARTLASAPPEDVAAIAAYIASLMADARANRPQPALTERSAADTEHRLGATLFAGACANCHGAGAPMMEQGRPSLAWGTALYEASPDNVLHVILDGLAGSVGRAGPSMPPFANLLSDAQIAAVAAYLRARFTDQTPWTDLEQTVKKMRAESTRRKDDGS
jgi:nicotinate dehydrogenase subunit B